MPGRWNSYGAVLQAAIRYCLEFLIPYINRFILNLLIYGIKHRQNSGGLEWTEKLTKILTVLMNCYIL